jgi:branched-chain amino acid transport system substrate-binding protein
MKFAATLDPGIAMKLLATNVSRLLGCMWIAQGILSVCWLAAFVCSPVLSQGSASEQESIRIAAIFASSGQAAAADISSLQGVRWAVSEINAAGGVLGRPLEVIELDNRSTPIGAKVAAEQAEASFATAIIGPGFSSHALSAARVAQSKSIPMISSTATNPKLTRIGDYIFRVCFSDDQQARVMGRFAYETLAHRKVLTMVNISSDYSLGLVEMFEEAFQQQGGIILARTTYKARQSNFRDLVKLAKNADPDAVFIGGHDESARIIVEAEQYGLKAVPLGGDGWDNPSFYNLGGNKIKHAYYSTHWHEAVDAEPSKTFVKRYRKDDMLLAPTALAYDAVKLLADAIERAASAERPAIRDALAKTKQFRAVTGTISFNKHGDPIKTIIIMKISDGRPSFLKQVRP